jgi:GT2 family glycosyltransferase
MMFSDEDLLTLEGKRVNPIFKPDWSPETTMSMMYTTHLGVYRKSIIDEIGGFRKGYEGSQDFDLVLRFSEKTTADKIYHIPQVLYHWRMIPGSTSVTYGEKSYAREAARKSIQDAVSRRKINAEVLDGNTLPSFRVKRKIDGNPLVSIVIPTKNKVELVKRCVESIQQKSTYHNYEIIIVDHESDDPKTVEWLKSIKDKVKVVPYKGVFNYSAINNYAIKEAAQGEQILLLNNDMEIISHDWIESMLEYSQLPEIGAVGARLLFPDGRVQHAGIILGICGPAGHSHKLFDRFANGYMDRIQIAQNIAAVTGACLMVKRSLFDEVNGLDEEHLAVAYNDVDFCLKLMEKGYRNIYTPFAELYHFESASRGLENSPEKIERLNREAEYMYKKWGEILKNDPFYNPNLSREREDFSLNMFD